MTVKERLREFISYKGMSVRAFEAKCGLSYGYIANMRVSLQPDKVMNIAKQFPDLNTGWLLTGEGNMLKTLAQTNNLEHSSSPISIELLQAMIEERKRHDEERKRHDEMNAELIRQNGSLIRLLEEKEKTVVQTEAAKCAVKSESGLQE